MEDPSLWTQFSPDYATARSRFRSAAQSHGWELQTYDVEAEGPASERLQFDVAVYPHASADRALVVSSGLHGVEAPLGSAVQLALLERWHGLGAAARGVRGVLIHNVNPFGFAWSRRVDGNN